jgi:hypothetical protein
MPQFYRLPNPAITSLSVDGFEHKVNPATGLLEVEMLTPNLVHDLIEVRGAVLVEPAEAKAIAEKADAHGKAFEVRGAVLVEPATEKADAEAKSGRGKAKEGGDVAAR